MWRRPGGASRSTGRIPWRLPGHGLDTRDGGPPVGGEFMIAVDPARCAGHGDRQRQLAHAEQLFAKILAQEGTRLPSDRRYAARLRTPTEGITVPQALYEELQRLA